MILDNGPLVDLLYWELRANGTRVPEGLDQKLDLKRLRDKEQWKSFRGYLARGAVETTTAILTELFNHFQKACTGPGLRQRPPDSRKAGPLLGEVRAAIRRILLELRIADHRQVGLGQLDAGVLRDLGFPDATVLACARATGRDCVLVTIEQDLRIAANIAGVKSLDPAEIIS